MFDIASLEVKQPFYIQSVNICIDQPCGPTRPLQKITADFVCKIIERGGVGAYSKAKRRPKNHRRPKNRNKFRPKPKTEIKDLAAKALVGFRTSLSVI